MQIRLREMRQARALSQVDLAELAGITHFSICRLETGRAQPRPSTIRKLASALNVDVAELIVSGGK